MTSETCRFTRNTLDSVRLTDTFPSVVVEAVPTVVPLRGDDKELGCVRNGSGNPEPQFRNWYRDGTLVTENSGLYEIQDKGEK